LTKNPTTRQANPTLGMQIQLMPIQTSCNLIDIFSPKVLQWATYQGELLKLINLKRSGDRRGCKKITPQTFQTPPFRRASTGHDYYSFAPTTV